MPPTQPDVSRGRISLVEDDPVMGGALLQRLSLEGYQVDWHRSGKAARSSMTGQPADGVICDIRLPDANGEELYAALRPLAPSVPFIFITGFGEVDQAVRLVKAGASDYLTKPFEIDVLLDQLARSVRLQATAGLLGASECMRSIEGLVTKVANLDSTLLITGESGVGKEVVARLAHSLSKRAAAPFVAVNCAAIPDALIEGELFGYERGAFTGADRQHDGYLARARQGTLFLDEIGDLSLSTQVKLLRVLQDREFRRLGATRSERLEARVICATHRDLTARIRDGQFREDLYYRIAVIPISIPPLRDRRTDVLPMLHAMVSEFSVSFGREIAGLAEDVPQRVAAYAWPGNVRELRNRAERAVALSERRIVRAVDLFPEDDTGPVAPPHVVTLAQAREDAERRQIAIAMQTVGGKVEEAARYLGVSRSVLFEKLRRHRGQSGDPDSAP